MSIILRRGGEGRRRSRSRGGGGWFIRSKSSERGLPQRQLRVCLWGVPRHTYIHIHSYTYTVLLSWAVRDEHGEEKER